MSTATIPLPPLEMRELVGCPDAGGFENPTGEPIWPDLPPSAWRTYVDFGCGCGRSARRLLQQHPRPERYVGIDVHRGMVKWAQEHLTAVAPTFEFHHHHVFSPGLNPDRSAPWAAPLPVEDGVATLVEATSVFTHLVEGQTEFYLDEVARVLAPEGVLISTWFLFDKDHYPFMQDNQNALYINLVDPTNAVVFDRGWLLAALERRGLMLSAVQAPSVRGFHWLLSIMRKGAGVEPVALPHDAAPAGRRPPPLLRVGADRIGLDEDATSGAFTRDDRQPLPEHDHAHVELAGAKTYIASLERALEAARRENERLAASVTGGTPA